MSRRTKYLISVLTGFVLGLLLCFIFIYLDLSELQMSLNIENMIDTIRSQRFYPVALILLPTLFGLMIYIFLSKQEQERNFLRQEEVHERNRRFGSLIVGLGHEINNPLTIIRGFTVKGISAINNENPLDKEKIQKDFKVIDYQALRISVLLEKLNELFTLSRETQKISFVMGDLVNSLLYKKSQVLRDANIYVSVSSNRCDKKISCNMNGLKKVFEEFIDNAVYFLKEVKNPQIDIKCSVFPKMLVLVFSDNGPGIPNDKREKIFDPLFSAKSINEATGLGLSIAKEWAESNKGTLEILDTKVGASFCLKIPLLKEGE